MSKVIIEAHQLTEYRAQNGQVVAFAIRAGKSWELVDANNGVMAPIVAFFKSKKELEHSFAFEIVKAFC